MLRKMFKKITAITLVASIAMSLVSGVNAASVDSSMGLNKGKRPIVTFQGEAVENIGVFNPEKMTKKEKEAYYKIVDEQVKLAKKNLGKSFNEKEFKKELLYVLETKDGLKTLNTRDVSKIAPQWSYTISIKNSIVSAAITTTINVALLAYGVGSVTALIKKVGVESARRIFYKTLYSRFMAWGANGLAVASAAAVDFIFNLLNPGEAIAKWADSKDPKPNNGYLDVVVGW